MNNNCDSDSDYISRPNDTYYDTPKQFTDNFLNGSMSSSSSSPSVMTLPNEES
jgi:hypothetical protein